MIRFLPLVLLTGLLGACAEMRTPAPASRIPPGLGVVAGDPLPAIAADAAAALRDAAAGLAGRPGATARAIGQMEFLDTALRADPRWAPLPTAVETDIRTARLEWRAALGIRAGAAPEAVAASLGRAAIALGANDTRAAAAALDPAVFEPGGAVTLARLAAPGPLPASRSASALTEGEMARLGRVRSGGLVNALDPDAGLLGLPPAGGPPPSSGLMLGR